MAPAVGFNSGSVHVFDVDGSWMGESRLAYGSSGSSVVFGVGGRARFQVPFASHDGSSHISFHRLELCCERVLLVDVVQLGSRHGNLQNGQAAREHGSRYCGQGSGSEQEWMDLFF